LNEYCIIIFVIIIIIFTVYINYFTKFKKTITIEHIVNNYKSGKNGLNLINDTDGNVYIIKNSFLQWFFTGPELYSSLKEGTKYEISGFGFRAPIIGMYPHITYAKELK
jgi:hypothetical protein